MGRRQFLALLRKDLLIELRTREMLLSMFLFAVLALVVFHYAFDPKGGADLTPLAGGMLWVVFLFAALLGLNRSFAREKDEGRFLPVWPRPVRTAVQLVLLNAQRRAHLQNPAPVVARHDARLLLRVVRPALQNSPQVSRLTHIATTIMTTIQHQYT